MDRHHLAATPLPAMVWTALLASPVLWVVELTGPRWLNLLLRGAWVVLVAAIVVMVVARVLSHRARSG